MGRRHPARRRRRRRRRRRVRVSRRRRGAAAGAAALGSGGRVDRLAAETTTPPRRVHRRSHRARAPRGARGDDAPRPRDRALAARETFTRGGVVAPRRARRVLCDPRRVGRHDDRVPAVVHARGRGDLRAVRRDGASRGGGEARARRAPARRDARARRDDASARRARRALRHVLSHTGSHTTALAW